MTQYAGSASSVVRRWQLAASFKELREQAGLTQEEAIAKLQEGAGRWSRSKLSRIENREHVLKPREAEQMLDAYGVTDAATREAFVRMAVESKSQGWWVRFGSELPEVGRALLSLESDLVELRDFQNQLVHGLLQTPDYARALMSAIHPARFSSEELEKMVAARTVRQLVLHKEPLPRLHHIVDQTVLDRVIGRPSVMRGQLRRLLEMAQEPNITIQVLPRSVGGPGLEGPFSILTMPNPIPDIGYVESVAGTFYLEDREHVRVCTMRFGILTELALSRADSMDLIAETMKSYE